MGERGVERSPQGSTCAEAAERGAGYTRLYRQVIRNEQLIPKVCDFHLTTV